MISFEHVSKVYEDSEEMALKDLSLQIEDGEFVFVVGDSGSGKSTFLRLLLRELRPTEGTIRVDETDLSEIEDSRELAYYRRKLGVVFQDFRLLSDRTVFENVALAQHVIGKGGEEIRTNVTEALTLVGLSAKYKSYPKNLSGGEQQRVAIARALVNHPRILLADEPTGNLDPGISLEIMRVLDEACRVRKTTTVVVTHDLEMVRQMKKRVITLHKGILADDEPAPEVPVLPEEEVASENEQSLENSVPETEPSIEESAPVESEPSIEVSAPVESEPSIEEAAPAESEPSIEESAPVETEPSIVESVPAETKTEAKVVTMIHEVEPVVATKKVMEPKVAEETEATEKPEEPENPEEPEKSEEPEEKEDPEKSEEPEKAEDPEKTEAPESSAEGLAEEQKQDDME